MKSPLLFWRLVFIAFLILYVAILISQLGHGLASLDGHGIIKVTRQLVDQHVLEVSRPPGHPTTEVYLLPAVAWLQRSILKTGFNEQSYLVLQGVAGVIGLCVFYSLLRCLGTDQWKAVLATVCLGFSAQYFSHTVDGEEFVFAVLFLILSLRLLIGDGESSPHYGQLGASLLCFALATGCRPEAVFAGFVYPLYALLRPKSSWKQILVIIVAEGFLIALVWLPILWIGLHRPYTSGMNVRESILGGCYRLVFQCFTLPVFILICWVLFYSFVDWRRRASDPFPQDFVFFISCTVPIVFFGALFLHASKPGHVLFAAPFLLLLAVRRSAGLLITWTALTLLGCVVTMDIFKDRQLVGPYPVAGSYFQAIRQKPFYKLAYLQQLLRHCAESPTVVIGDLWRWDLEYHLARGTFSGREEKVHGTDRDVPMFIEASSAASAQSPGAAGTIGQPLMSHCVLLPRDGALDRTVVESLHARGYAIKMDAVLYRMLFTRYNVTGPAPAEGRIGTAAIELFATAQR